MATSGTFTKSGDTFTGSVKTLNIQREATTPRSVQSGVALSWRRYRR